MVKWPYYNREHFSIGITGKYAEYVCCVDAVDYCHIVSYIVSQAGVSKPEGLHDM